MAELFTEIQQQPTQIPSLEEAADLRADALRAGGAAVLPFVSVVIPVRNDALRLERVLRTLNAQNYPRDRFEVIVINNGSHDGSDRVAQQAGAIVLQHAGLRVGALRNRGVAIGRGELIAFVDSDHEVPSHWIATAVADLQAHPEIGMLGSPCLAPPDGTWVQTVWELHRLRHQNRAEVEWLGAGNMFVRRHLFEAVGGFQEELIAGEDVDLCVRVVQQGAKIVSDLKCTNIHHGEPVTLWHFFRKELWRGSSGLRGFFSHGMPLHELPSFLFPLYHLLTGLGFVATLVLALMREVSGAWVGVTLGLWWLPACLLAVKTAGRQRRWSRIPALAVLYWTFGMSRAAALFR